MVPPRSIRTPLSVLTRTLPAFLLAISIAFARSGPAGQSGAADDPPVGWWRNALFYEVFVRSFADATHGPLANDGVGDLQGLIDHLDYLNDGHGTSAHSLGVNALWLMPIQPSPSYHGYDVTNYRAVNPQYGDLALMKRFVAAAHRRGIRVILDLVLNHASSLHPLFLQALSPDRAAASAARNYFRFAPRPEQDRGPWGEPVWHRAGNLYYYGVFSPEMPDWNFENPAVTKHHEDVAKFWLRDVGVDGFRLDAVRYFFEEGNTLQDTEETRRWLRDFTADCHRIKPGAFVIGEDTAGSGEVARCILGRSLDSAFEFELAADTVDAVDRGAPAILTGELDRLRRLYGSRSPWATLITNHDQERARTKFHGDRAKLRLATELLFTLPGVTFIYYGEELGLAGAKPDPELRTPMPWTSEPPNAGFTAPNVKPWHVLTPRFAVRNVATESADPGSMLSLYRRLILMRGALPPLRHGSPIAVSTHGGSAYVEVTAADGEVALVIGNFSASAAPGPTLDIRKSPLRRSWKYREMLSDSVVAIPFVNADGGCESWRPISRLAPESLCVIRCAPGDRVR